MQTLVVPALPFFQREFDTSPEWTTWLVTSFLLSSSSVLTPIIGKLGDAHGKKRMLVISLAIFAPREPGCGGGAEHRRADRVPGAAGRGRGDLPAELRDHPRRVPGARRSASAIGTVSSVFGIGGGVGLVLSGVIVEHLSWHWLFLIGAIPVLVATALIAKFVPESPIKTPAKPDYMGAAALSRRLRGAPARAERGHAVGLDVRRACSRSPRSAPRRSRLGRDRAPRRRTRSSTCRRSLRPGMAATNASTILLGFSMTAFFVLVPGFLQSPTRSASASARPRRA